MLACLQRSHTHTQSHAPQHHLMGTPKMPELQLPIPRKSEMSSSSAHGLSRYPTPAELDAYARKMADSPLSIKIFPTNIRVPQHKQIGRTVNGLDTTGQRYSPYSQPYSGGYQGLLAVVRTPSVTSSNTNTSSGSGSGATKGVLKNSEGKRTKLSPSHIAVAPYAPPANSAMANRLRHKAYSLAHCGKPLEVANIPAPPHNVIMAAASVVPVSGTGQALSTLGGSLSSELPVQNLLRHMGRPSLHVPHHAQGLQPLGEAQTSSSSPALQAATASSVLGGHGCKSTTATDSTGYPLAAPPPPHSGLAYSGAVLPMQSAETTTATGGQYMDSVDYTLWQQHKQHKHQQQQQQQHHQQQQHYHQGALRMYGANSGGGAVVSRSPETCVPQLAFRGGVVATSSGGGALGSGSFERLGSSPLHCPAMHGEFSVGQFFAPPWNSVLATPDSDSYSNPLELPLGSTMATATTRDMVGLSHHHHHHHNHLNHHQAHHGLPQHFCSDGRGGAAAAAAMGLCCSAAMVGPSSRTLCHASVLSSSLQSLECLISEIHPPCIKERMLGRGYEAVAGSLGMMTTATAMGTPGAPLLLDHTQQQQQPTHIQLPVFR
ncbi:protein FAM222A [Engraulis encrasicolus]|uniref:protein FAM222A n=1 Tax=Engraulis encrasicolus TaxID=184585 RepID=UPI002FD03504